MKLFSNGTLNHKAVIAITLTALFFGCAKKEEETPSIGTGGLTAAEVAGNRWSSCTAVSSAATFGAAVNGLSYMRGMSLMADGTYGISTLFFTGASCAMGGDHLFTVSQAGTFQTGGLLDSGATQIVYTAIGTVLTNYGGAGANETTWAGYFDTATCVGGSDLVVDTNATDTNEVTGLTCSKVSNPDFAFPEFAPLGTVFYDSIALTDSTPGSTVVTVGDMVQLWNLGQAGSYPSSATQTFSE
ncbi:hypothetical protein [Bdellovibrio bacteriovorus]|uniref:Lipoprotein n=1 Tax=Bdellovibrio bacteriovorus str. Tiberius TaxID=1069642 RepID=K7ZEC4_BDEBC|nr:hypothetical protein [Bdellovibrio bacteriovorus]AFY00337.1 Hypothetical protein Bdt_0629 [Bdellovibrio bacteriovorus str. Tiberius]